MPSAAFMKINEPFFREKTLELTRSESEVAILFLLP